MPTRCCAPCMPRPATIDVSDADQHALASRGDRRQRARRPRGRHDLRAREDGACISAIACRRRVVRGPARAVARGRAADRRRRAPRARSQFAGRRVDYGYLPAAHTDGDLFVHFAGARTCSPSAASSPRKRWPLLDYRNGAWFGGRVRAVERLAELGRSPTRASCRRTGLC